MSGGNLVPASFMDELIQTVTKQIAYVQFSTEMYDDWLIAQGKDPTFGYWQRTLDERIRTANFRYRHPWTWFKNRSFGRLDRFRSRLAYWITPSYLRDRDWDDE